MYSVSNDFKTYIAMPDRTFETKALVGTTSYDNTKVVEFDIEDSVIASDDFSIGNVIPSKLTITIKSTDSIATNAKISPAVRLNGVSGWAEWVPLGSYYIDSRTFQNDVWKFTCYDKLILAQQAYVSSLTYPAHMSAVMNEITGQLGIVLDPSVVINASYMIPYKDEDITIRDMISYIASAHGASARMTKDEKLTFVKFVPGAVHTSVLASDYFKVSQTNPLKTYTKILLTYNTDGETLTSGSGDDDHTLKLYNPFMSQSILDSVLSAINGFNYTPFTMDWKGRPDLEIGDGLTVTQRDGSTFPTTILTSKMSFKGGLKATTTAPSYAAQRSEFDYQGSLSKQVASAVKLEKPYYGVTIGRANGIVVEKSDGSGKLTLNSDTIEMSDEAGSPILKLDGVTRKLLLSAVVQMLAGSSIDWNAVNTPSAEQVGAKDIDWHPDIEDVSDLAGRLTHIDGLGIYTGTLTAQQIQAIAIETLTISGALNCGNTLQIGPPNEEGTCHINTAADGIRFQSHRGGSYTKIEDDGSVSFYAGDVCYAWIKPDGTTNLTSTSGGGGYKVGDTIKASNLSVIQPIVWTADALYPKNVTVDTVGNVYTSSSSGVRKYNSDGGLIWAKTDVVFAYDVAVDDSGNVYSAHQNSSGTKTVRKLNSSGTELWSKTEIGYVYGIAVDSSGNVYVAYNSGVRKYNSSGTLIWSKNDVGNAYSVAVDSSGNVYVAYRQGAGKTVRKLDSSGNELWYKNDSANGYDITLDSSGNVYVAYDVTAMYGYPSVRKFNSSGTELWSKKEIGNAYGVAVDSSGNVYVAYEPFGIRKLDSAGNDIWYIPSNGVNAVATGLLGHIYTANPNNTSGLIKLNADLSYTINS